MLVTLSGGQAPEVQFSETAFVFGPVTCITDLGLCSPFYWHWLTLIPACISNHIRDGITDSFLNFNGATIEVYKWISNFALHFTGACDYLSMLGLRLNHVSKRGHRWRICASRSSLAWEMGGHLCGHESLCQLTYWFVDGWIFWNKYSRVPL